VTAGERVDPTEPVREGLPRPIQVALALAAIVAGAPLLAACAVAVRLSSPGPILFRQTRVGRGGRPFTLYKFRTMTPGTLGAQVTAEGDLRVTRIGRILRATKLDELPELWNVVEGTMALVGPRPEVPHYVDSDDPLWRAVLAAPPGITSPMTAQLRDEERLMAAVRPEDRERFYSESLLRYKLLGHLSYLQRRSAWSDVRVLAETALAIAIRRHRDQPTPENIARTAREGLSPV
jgi:lipopolysaccharide/colanic/teichoic acid biosynthesis glycosyltransferase